MTRMRTASTAMLMLALTAAWLLWEPGRASRFEAADCWFEASPRFACGYLVVPENRAARRSADIRLPVVRVKPQGEDTAPDPILFINGGPGGDSGLGESTIWGWTYQIDRTPWMRKREMILMDLRGTGLATPSLNCPEMDATAFRVLYELQDDPDSAWQEVGAASDACRERLVAAGRDLAAYNSIAAAHDIAELRDRLALPALNIYASSYGTRIAQMLMRDHPQGLRSVILESPVPADVDLLLQQQGGLPRVVEHIGGACDADPACSGRYPDLARRFAQRIEALDRSPLWVRIQDPITHKPKVIAVTGLALQELLVHALYGGDTLRFMPPFLNRLIEGDESELQEWMQRDLWAWYGADSMSEGVYYSFTCAEQVPFSDIDAVVTEADRYPAYNASGIVGSQDLAICETWPVEPIAAADRLPVSSDVPALLLSGELDAITPPGFAAQTAAQLTAAHEFVFPLAGHAPLTHAPCANEVAAEFLDRPTERPEAGCLAASSRPPPIATGKREE